MLRTPVLLKFLSLCLLAHAGLAMAQQKPSEAPPKLDVIEQGSDTPITVTPPKSGGAKVTEKKEGGRVTEVKVKTGKSSYTMKAGNPAATSHPGATQSSALKPPQWSVLEFDLGKKKKTDSEVPEPTPAPPPPPLLPASK